VRVYLNPPLSAKATNDAAVDRVLDYFKATKLKLGASKMKQLEREIRRRIETWQSNTSGLHDKLREYSDFLEGKQEMTDFPFGPGQSSNIDIRYAAAQARTLRASFIRSVFTDPKLVVAKMAPGKSRSKDTNAKEEAVNWTMAEESNAIEALKDTPIPIFRDGTSLIYGEWDRRIDRGFDYATFFDVAGFQSEYPDAEAAGISEEEYDGIIEHLTGMEAEVNVEYQIDFVAKNGPEYTTFPLAKFIWFPLFSREMESLDLYGYYYRETGSRFEANAARNFYIPEAVEACRKKGGGYGDYDSWESRRDELEGINADDDEASSYQIAKLVVRCDLDKDNIQETYWVYWDMDAKKVLRVEAYKLWKNTPCVVPERFLRRDGRLLGVSLLGDGLDLYRSVNALHRHRSNNRRLTDSVTLLMPNSIKDDVDLGAEYAEFKPGMTLWVPDAYMDSAKAPRQLVIQDLSRSNGSMDEEQLLMKHLDLLVGVSQGQSGRESPTDPDAPASKTAMLLARSDLRGEDLILEFARTIPALVRLHLALYRQNASSKVGYVAKTQEGVEDKAIDLAALTDGTEYALKPTKLSMHPEQEMNRIAAVAAAAMKFGFPVQIKPEILGALWNEFVIASRIENPEQYQIDAQNPMAAQQIMMAMQGMMGGSGDNSGGKGTAKGAASEKRAAQGQNQAASGAGQGNQARLLAGA